MTKFSFFKRIRSAAKTGMIEPVFLARDRVQYFQGLLDPKFSKLKRLEEKAIEKRETDTFHINAFCLCCARTVEMLVDFDWFLETADGKKTVNWRERMVCPSCGMNNRQRLVATLIKQFLVGRPRTNVYFMEQITPIFDWAKKSFGQHELNGSEYLGYQYRGGETVNGVRHEDVMHLSFANEAMQLIVSNDVLEHVPDPHLALRECARILAPGGQVILTAPFYSHLDHSVARAEMTDEGIRNILPPAFHSNPVSEKGALVFTDFGWDLLEAFKSNGFSDAVLAVYASDRYGHLGGGQMVFQLRK